MLSHCHETQLKNAPNVHVYLYFNWLIVWSCSFFLISFILSFRMKVTASASTELSSKFVLLRKQSKNLIKSNYHYYLKALSEELKTDPSKFWSFYSLKCKSKGISQTISFDNVVASYSRRKAELFNGSFGTVFSKPSASSPSIIDVVNPNLLMNIELTDENVEKILKNLNPSKPTYLLEFSKTVRRNWPNPLKDCSVYLINIAVYLYCGRGQIFHSFIRMVTENWSVIIHQSRFSLYQLNAWRGR